MNELLVSVHMITYNHASFIREAIDGVLRQETNFRFELVIGEDCSTDATRRIIMEYQQKHPHIIRIVTSDSNVGILKNMQRTTKACFGKYIAFCEGDDYWQHPLKLQKQVDLLELRTDWGMVHSDHDAHHMGSGRVIRNFMKYRYPNCKVPIEPDIETILTECRETFRIQTCTTMLRRDLCAQITGSDPYLYSGHFPMADTQLWAEMSRVGKIGFIPESLATYRLLVDSGSRSRDRSKMFKFERADMEMRFYLCKKHQLSEGVRRKIELNWCRNSFWEAFHMRNRNLAAEAKRKKGVLTLKERLFVLGAGNPFSHFVLRCGIRGRNLFRKYEIH